MKKPITVSKLQLIAIFLVFSIFSYHQIQAQTSYDIIIRNARVLDGSGNPWFYADVAISGERISAIGNLEEVSANEEIDASGLYLAPGFIDVHSHAGPGLASADRSHAHPLLAQGITTVIINPDGGGPVDLAMQRKALLKDGLGVNVIQLIGHGSVRKNVMGYEDRFASESELKQMKNIVRKGMEDGAFGLSSGPFYTPGSYSNTEELVELSKITGKYGGVYTSHIRDESSYTIGVIAAVDEVIQIAREAQLPSIVTHIKVLGPTVWGYSQAVIQRIKSARQEGLQVYADQYPYLASATGLGAALLPRWAQAGGRDSLIARFNDAETMKKIHAAMQENLARRGGAHRIQFRYYQPNKTVEGRTLKDIAETWQMSPINAAIKMLREGNAGIISFNMHQQDVHNFMQQSWMMTSSDGSFPKWGEGVPHPRGLGAFPRKIHQYVIVKEVVDLPTAIRSMTTLPAQVFKIPDRGIIRKGALADLVIFDLEKIRDRATFTEPYQLAEGMIYVFINGKAAIFQEKFTNEMRGKVLRRK